MSMSGLFRVRGRSTGFLLALLLLAGPALADTAQQVAQVMGRLQRAEANLALVQGTVGGTAQPTGSKAKLARLRLDQALSDITPAASILEGLPADDAGVAEARQRYDAAVALAQSLAERLEPKAATVQAAPAAPAAPAAAVVTPPPAASAPAPTVPPAPAVTAQPVTQPAASADTTVKLGYRQEEALSGARFNLREVEGDAARLTEVVATLRPVADQLGIDHRKVGAALDKVENARRKAGFVRDALAPLPANGRGVAEVQQRLVNADAQVETAALYLVPLNDRLAALIDPATYPHFRTDLERVRELSAMYADPMVLENDRARAAAILPQGEAANAEVTRIARVYVRLMEQETEMGKQIEGAGNAFLGNYRGFLAAAEQHRQTLPAQIRADLADVDGIASTAVAEKKPLFFTGGVPQRMGFAREKLALYEVLDPANAPALVAEVDAMQASLDERERSLATLIIQQNPLPPDRYTGGDRDKVVAVAMDAWSHQQPEFEMLTARIPSEAWNRETMWQYSNGTWYFVDRSRLQVQLVLAEASDDTLAIVRPVNIWMNHQKGDTLTGTPVFAGDDPTQPSNFLLRAKVK